jgi:N-acetyl-gamma-glutamylphosphate reductase
MTYLNAMTQTRGFLITDQKGHPTEHRLDFVSAAAFLRARPLTIMMLSLARHHCIFDSKRVTRSIVDLTAAYRIKKDNNQIATYRQFYNAVQAVL